VSAPATGGDRRAGATEIPWTVRTCSSRPPLEASKAVYGVRVRVPNAFEELRVRSEMPRADPTATAVAGRLKKGEKSRFFF
jgi:hypothetical protein